MEKRCKCDPKVRWVTNDRSFIQLDMFRAIFKEIRIQIIHKYGRISIHLLSNSSRSHQFRSILTQKFNVFRRTNVNPHQHILFNSE